MQDFTTQDPPSQRPFGIITSAELDAMPFVTPAPLAEQVEPTWPAILAAVPELAACERAARAADPEDFREWSRIKRQFSKFVGWEATDPRLATNLHYDATYDALLAAFERKAVRS